MSSISSHHIRVIGVLTIIVLITIMPAGASIGPAKSVGLAGPDDDTSPNCLAITDGNRVIGFNSASPERILLDAPVSGLAAGEKIIALDFDSTTGTALVLTNRGRLCRLSLTNFVAVSIGFDPARLTGNLVDIEFDPITKLVRVVTDTGEHILINSRTGNIIDVLSKLHYDSLDPNADKEPRVSGAALPVAGSQLKDPFIFDHSFLYLIDPRSRQIARLGKPADEPVSPDTGRLFSIGSLNVNVSSVSGFDIAPKTNAALAIMTPEGETSPKLYRINLATGQATEIGTIGSGKQVDAFTITGEINEALCFFNPTSINGVIGQEKTVTAVVLFNANRLTGQPVEFKIVSGPNAGKTGTVVTDENGVAAFTYTSNGKPGADLVTAHGTFMAISFSSEGTVSWEDGIFISAIQLKGKNIIVQGINFKQDDQVTINDTPRNVIFQSSLQLKVKKGVRALFVCTDETPRTNQVKVFRNPLTNPGPAVQDTKAFATCP